MDKVLKHTNYFKCDTPSLEPFIIDNLLCSPVRPLEYPSVWHYVTTLKRFLL
jgi:hypothetical protein